MTVVFDPRWPLARLARVGRDLSFGWLALNGLRLPTHLFLDPKEANRWRQGTSGKDLINQACLGVHLSEGDVSAVALDLTACLRGSRYRAHDGRITIHAPGSFEDFTPLGVLCHEVGHHVDFQLDRRGFSKRNKAFARALEDEPEVSSVEHNVQESFAEAIRLFITNPSLLEAGRPRRWEFLTKTLRLRPIHQSSWRRVLGRCAQHVRSSAQLWTEEG